MVDDQPTKPPISTSPFQDPDQDKYYSSIPKNFSDTFVDLDALNRTTGGVKEHPMLSKSYRRAATIPLSFRFPFYGHEVDNNSFHYFFLLFLFIFIIFPC